MAISYVIVQRRESVVSGEVFGGDQDSRRWGKRATISNAKLSPTERVYIEMGKLSALSIMAGFSQRRSWEGWRSSLARTLITVQSDS